MNAHRQGCSAALRRRTVGAVAGSATSTQILPRPSKPALRPWQRDVLPVRASPSLTVRSSAVLQAAPHRDHDVIGQQTTRNVPLIASMATSPAPGEPKGS